MEVTIINIVHHFLKSLFEVTRLFLNFRRFNRFPEMKVFQMRNLHPENGHTDCFTQSFKLSIVW